MKIVRDYEEAYDAMVGHLTRQPERTMSEARMRRMELFEELVDANRQAVR